MQPEKRAIVVACSLLSWGYAVSFIQLISCQCESYTQQASRIVLNLDDWHGDFAALQNQFKNWPMPDLIEIFIVNGGKVTRILP